MTPEDEPVPSMSMFANWDDWLKALTDHYWLAGYRAAQEQAAAVAERHEAYYTARDKTKMADASGDIAAAIRAMKPKETGDE